MVTQITQRTQILAMVLHGEGILSDDVLFAFVVRSSKSELLRFFQQKQTFIPGIRNKAVIS